MLVFADSPAAEEQTRGIRDVGLGKGMSVEKELQQRIAANESAFRDVNEAIARGQWPGEQDAPASFRCECARFGCNELVELSLREYEHVRSHPRRFVVLPGHELPEVETVVERSQDYFVVEKTDAAGRAAEAMDDRTD
jgi:hypothetical protein